MGRILNKPGIRELMTTIESCISEAILVGWNLREAQKDAPSQHTGNSGVTLFCEKIINKTELDPKSLNEY